MARSGSKTAAALDKAFGTTQGVIDLQGIHKSLRSDILQDSIIMDDEILTEVISEIVGELVVGLNSDTKALIKRLTKSAIEEEWSQDELAKRISRMVGLDPRRAIAVENYRKKLISDGTPKGRARQRSERYAKNLQRQRAQVVAGNEVARAVAEAKRRTWAQARESGQISRYAVRIWNTAKDEMTCKVCRPMNGKRASVGRKYKSGVPDGPPAHPSCRCTETLQVGTVVIGKEDESDLGPEFKYRLRMVHRMNAGR